MRGHGYVRIACRMIDAAQLDARVLMALRAYVAAREAAAPSW